MWSKCNSDRHIYIQDDFVTAQIDLKSDTDSWAAFVWPLNRTQWTLPTRYDTVAQAKAACEEYLNKEV